MNTSTSITHWLEMPILEMLEWHEEVQQVIEASKEEVAAALPEN